MRPKKVTRALLESARSRAIRFFPHLLLIFAVMLPFAAGLFAGDTFYFRDISRAFYPQRLYAVRGLLLGELRHWNPLVHEGIPLFPPPVSYPLDLLQALLPSHFGLSLLLVLHVPLGVLGLYGLSRHVFSAPKTAAFGGALIYGLGGFYLSCVNLYVHLLAAAWAPFIVWSILWSMKGSVQRTLIPSIATAVGLSTSGIEIVAQALFCAMALAAARHRFRATILLRIGMIAVLSAALAAPVLLSVFAQIEGSERAVGFPPNVVLANSVYPLSLFQTIVADWHGPLSDLVNRFWGGNFFPIFPYFLSLYLGAAAICIAAASIMKRDAAVRSLAVLSLLGMWFALGNWSGLSFLVESFSALRIFRSPSKAFFTVHLSVSLLAAAALHELACGNRRVWRFLLFSSGLLGSGLVSSLLLPRLSPRCFLRFAQGFFPPGYAPALRVSCLNHIIHDAAIGGLLTFCVAALAALVLLKRLSPARAAVLTVFFIGMDLLRTGAGLNPMVPAERLRASPEMKWLSAAIRSENGRLFTCDPELNPAFFRARSRIRRHSLWTFLVFSETLTPSFNMDLDVPTALSRDLTMMAPMDRALSLEEVGCDPRTFDKILADLRAAGVSHVVSLTPIDHHKLAAVRVLAPRDISPLQIHVHRLRDAVPTRFVARHARAARDQSEARAIARSREFLLSHGAAVEGLSFETRDAVGSIERIEERSDEIALDVRADRRTVAIVRDAFAPGWKATVNGKPARLLRADGRHRAIPIDPGASRVVLTYHPPGLGVGLIFMAAALASMGAWLLAARYRSAANRRPATRRSASGRPDRAT